MYEHMRDNGQSTIVLSNAPGIYPRRSHIGEYDQIVCEGCERIFSPWDDYANELLLNEWSDNNYFETVEHGRLSYDFAETDYAKLKLFFLSVLWRANASSRPMFSRISLGPHANNLSSMLRASNPGDWSDFAVTVTRYTDEYGRNILLDPHPVRFGGVNYVQINLAGYVVYIRVDRRHHKSLHTTALRPGQPLRVLLRDMTKSKEFEVVKKIVLQNS